uniref:Plasmid partitioning protein ParA n=1 Tax=Marinitoga okinawensis TaxID=389480 RepID=A0A9C7GWE8_9BACT|nr:Plasmid partitioning protein ParA [Marinitoga okinawensis]
MKVISINNMKGGVGKTFIVFNLATYINFLQKSKKNKKILVIDLDPQANTSENFLDNEQLNYTEDLNISMLFEEDIDIPRWKSLIMPTKFENIDIVPSLLTLAKVENSSINIMDRTSRLKYFIDEYGKNYDYIIIDNPPSTNIFTANALKVAEYIFIPLLPDRLSLVGLDLMFENILIAQKFNKNLKVGGLILNMLDRRYKTHSIILNVLERKFSNYIINPPLGKKADFQTALDMKEPLFKVASTSSKAHIQMAELMKNIIKIVNQEGGV